MNELHVLNLGAGVQSTTLYLMALRGEIAFDVAVFADTQEEPQEVYKHLSWLKSLGGVRIITATAGKLGADLIHGKNTTGRFAAIPAFTTKDGGKTRGMTKRQCSKEYKTEVIVRAIRRDVLGLKPRQRVPRALAVTQAFGITMDEGGRARRIVKRFAADQKWARPVFPLLDRFMTRADCLTWLAKFGNVPHDVPRSACVFCPFHTDAEWARVKRDPADWARALEIDVALRTSGSVANRDMRQVMYLHESCKPLGEVELKPKPRDRQIPMSFYRECEGVCGV